MILYDMTVGRVVYIVSQDRYPKAGGVYSTYVPHFKPRNEKEFHLVFIVPSRANRKRSEIRQK